MRDPRFTELDEAIAAGWGDVPETVRPEDWKGRPRADRLRREWTEASRAGDAGRRRRERLLESLRGAPYSVGGASEDRKVQHEPGARPAAALGAGAYLLEVDGHPCVVDAFMLEYLRTGPLAEPVPLRDTDAAHNALANDVNRQSANRAASAKSGWEKRKAKSRATRLEAEAAAMRERQAIARKQANRARRLRAVETIRRRQTATERAAS